MKYRNIHKGKFISRPNRFIANVEINAQTEICHVKNTGRCKELLVSGCTVYLEKSDNPKRKTMYDLVAVQKGERLINMDSQAPNKAVEEWLKNHMPFGKDMEVFAEKTFGSSRFDFCLKSNKTDRTIYLEVKGCTLENNGVVKFPDAPTQRGTKHIYELINCTEQGYEAVLLILVQMDNVKFFTPNYDTDPNFGQALKEAKEKGVTLLCYDCKVTPDSMSLNKSVEIKL